MSAPQKLAGRLETGTGLGIVGLAEAASNLAGDSLIDRLGAVAIAATPLPVVEETIKHLGITDKPFLRANLAVALGTAAGLALPGRRSLRAQALLAGAGLLAAAAGRARLDGIEESRTGGFELPAVEEPLGEATDGAEDWPGAEPLFTEPGRFYRTDINMRPPALDPGEWALEIELPSGSARLGIEALLAMPLRERDAILACVHNRPGWDRLGQQRWTGLPIGEVLDRAGELPPDPSTYDLVCEAADGYTQIIPLSWALERRSWIVVGMGGQPLPRAHGYPARVMTPGIVGQYNGVKWLTALRVVPIGSEETWWGARHTLPGERGWPRGPIEVKPMARIDHPANTGMPPRLPSPPVEVGAGPTEVVGTAWAPPHGVGAVELRIDGGAWRECELARELNGDSWRRWRAEVELGAGEHRLEVRCVRADGLAQAGFPEEPFPFGSGAYHRVELTAN